MKIEVEIMDRPLSSRRTTSSDGVSGALVEFAGVVRAEEGGRPIVALNYEAYEAMACSETERILRELEKDFPCHFVRVAHRIGRVPVGEAAILVCIEAKHRAEAFGLLSAFMDRLKKDVPVWKSAP